MVVIDSFFVIISSTFIIFVLLTKVIGFQNAALHNKIGDKMNKTKKHEQVVIVCVWINGLKYKQVFDKTGRLITTICVESF